MISVILCDDHALIRRGIRDTLADAADWRLPAPTRGRTRRNAS